MASKAWTGRRLLGLVLLGWAASAGRGQDVGSVSCKERCPPWVEHCSEGPPRLKFKDGHPRPICDPCALPHYGYYSPTWQAYPYESNGSPCSGPALGARTPTPQQEPTPAETPAVATRGPALPATPAGEPPLPTQPEKGNAPSASPPSWLPPSTLVSGPRTPEEGATSPVRFESKELRPLETGPALDLDPPAPQRMPAPAPLPTLPPPGTPPTPQPINQTSLTTSSQRDDSEGIARAVVKEVVAAPPEMPSPNTLVRQPSGPSNPPADSVQTPPAMPRMPTPPGTPAPRDVPPQRPRQMQGSFAMPGMRMVSSKKVILDFDGADRLAPGQRIVLWRTRDGKSWEEERQFITQAKTLVVEVEQEGLYGFTIASTAATQSTPQAPQGGPQLWIEVDWTAPKVNLIEARTNLRSAGCEMLVTWLASDRNLARQPVTLSWATTPEGPWTTFASNVSNTGRYTWQIPAHVPASIFVRLEVFDFAGNVGIDQTSGPLLTKSQPNRAPRP